MLLSADNEGRTMSRYDGLIIPRSYSEYINKTDAATLLQALQLSGIMDSAPTENSNKPIKSSGVYTSLKNTPPVFALYRAGTYTTTYITRQDINNTRMYAGLLTGGTDADGGSVYLQVDGMRGDAGWTIIGYWRVLDTGLTGRTALAPNGSIWLQKGNSSTVSRLSSTEIAEKQLEIFFIALKV
jgi:hypothetical protein